MNVENKFIDDIIKGDEAAFKTLVEKNQDRVFNTCLGFLHNTDDAEDIAQDVFIEVFRSIDKFNRNSSLSTWIYRIAVNKSLDFIKMNKRQKRWSLLTRVSTENANQDENLFAHFDTPQISMEQKERIRILNAAIDKLPEKQKTAFTLHKYESLPYAEIAEVLSTTVSSVESLLHRAKKNLSISLEKYYKNELF